MSIIAVFEGMDDFSSLSIQSLKCYLPHDIQIACRFKKMVDIHRDEHVPRWHIDFSLLSGTNLTFEMFTV